MKSPPIILICPNCGCSFSKRLAQYKSDLKKRGGNHVFFCTHRCFSDHLISSQTKECGHCGSLVTRTARCLTETKSGNIFCNRSCAVSYNNAHKTTGTRRSKLEVWLEERLRESYPDLDIHTNRTDAIGMELDFYFPALNLAFEINGIFHYEPIYNGPEGLKATQARDAKKIEACRESGVDLVIVDTYHEPTDPQIYLNQIRSKIDGVIQSLLARGILVVPSTDPLRGRTSIKETCLPVPRKPTPTKIQWPDVGTLMTMVDQTSVSQTARTLGVTANSVKHWLIRRGTWIPRINRTNKSVSISGL